MKVVEDLRTGERARGLGDGIQPGRDRRRRVELRSRDVEPGKGPSPRTGELWRERLLVELAPGDRREHHRHVAMGVDG